MLAGAAASEIPARDDDRELRVQRAFLHKSCRVERIGQSPQRVRTELLVLFGNRRYQVKELRRDDLVGVDVVSHHIDRPRERRLHADNLADGRPQRQTEIRQEQRYPARDIRCPPDSTLAVRRFCHSF